MPLVNWIGPTSPPPKRKQEEGVPFDHPENSPEIHDNCVDTSQVGYRSVVRKGKSDWMKKAGWIQPHDHAKKGSLCWWSSSHPMDFSGTSTSKFTWIKIRKTKENKRKTKNWEVNFSLTSVSNHFTRGWSPDTLFLDFRVTQEICSKILKSFYNKWFRLKEMWMYFPLAGRHNYGTHLFC